MMRALLVFLFGVCAAMPARAKPLEFQKVENCRWKADRWNDGDSFHAITGDAGREIVARLYFVDTPEAETAYRDRLNAQAAYFGITREQAVEIAHESGAFTAKRLAAPFTVWTRWRSALGRSALGRVYCIIITAEGRDLNELLVENGAGAYLRDAHRALRWQGLAEISRTARRVGSAGEATKKGRVAVQEIAAKDIGKRP